MSEEIVSRASGDISEFYDYRIDPQYIEVGIEAEVHTITIEVMDMDGEITFGSGWSVRNISYPQFFYATVENATRYKSSIHLEINDNTYGSNREGSFEVWFNDYKVGEVTIYQSGEPAYSVSGNTNITLSSKSGQYRGLITLESNFITTWNIEEQIGNWFTCIITPNPSKISKFGLDVTLNESSIAREGSVKITANNEFEVVINITQDANVPEYSGEFWSVPPMFMDGTDSIYYMNSSGETFSSDEIKINRNIGENNHALCSTPYYDSDIRLCFKDGENKPVDGSNVLVFYNKPAYFTDDFGEKYAVYLTDDTPEMLRLNDGKPCWIYNQSEINDNLETILEYPQFSRYITSGKRVVDSLNIGNPIKTFTLDHTITPDTDIYSKRWKKYMEDQYSRNTRILECYVRIPYGLMQDYLRNFFYFDNSYWILIEVVDYNLTKEQSCKCKFIKVNDTNNYTNGQII